MDWTDFRNSLLRMMHWILVSLEMPTWMFLLKTIDPLLLQNQGKKSVHF